MIKTNYSHYDPSTSIWPKRLTSLPPELAIKILQDVPPGPSRRSYTINRGFLLQNLEKPSWISNILNMFQTQRTLLLNLTRASYAKDMRDRLEQFKIFASRALTHENSIFLQQLEKKLGRFEERMISSAPFTSNEIADFKKELAPDLQRFRDLEEAARMNFEHLESVISRKLENGAPELERCLDDAEAVGFPIGNPDIGYRLSLTACKADRADILKELSKRGALSEIGEKKKLELLKTAITKGKFLPTF